MQGSFTHVYLDIIDQCCVMDYRFLFENRKEIQEAGIYRVEKYGASVKLKAVH